MNGESKAFVGETPARINWFAGEIVSYLKLWRGFSAEGDSAFMEQGICEGWLEPADELQKDDILEKRVAARIVHQFLRLVLKEQDEDDWSAATRLKDLYDCRTCVNHVAQVYCKGIIEGEEKDSVSVFGMRSLLGENRARLIVERMFRTSLRIQMSSENCAEAAALRPEHISAWEAEELQRKYLQTGQGFRLIDVRSREEYEREHGDGAESFPMTEILENPEIMGKDREIPLLIYCDLGYRSEIVANCLSHAGFVQVRYFAMVK